MTDMRTALIVGCGVSGLVAAIACRRAGIEPTVVEAYPAPAAGIGKLLLMAPNGINALRAIGAGEVAEAGPPLRRTVVESRTGRRLAAFTDLAGLPASRMFDRAELYRALHEAAVVRGVTVAFGKRLVASANGPGGVTARFADGSTVEADVLIGADGIHSTVRSLLDPDAPQPRYVGLLGFGGTVAEPGVRSTGGAFHYALGSRAVFAYNVSAQDGAGWFTGLPWPEPLTAAEMSAVPNATWLRRIEDGFAGDRIPALSMLSRMRPDELVTIGRMDAMPPLPVWHRDRMVLVGDAAHAVSPSSGQGGSLAVESAVELVRCLRDLPTVASAFATYEALRRDRVAKVIAGTALFDAPPRPTGPLAKLAMAVVTPLAMRSTRLREKSIGWLHRYTIDWNEQARPVVV
jgi:2-polyprenyl-6-methoxyphenol hydroxylase-like FAD-dependent oxidoreductase